jgi:hypothetical protein
MSYHNNHYVPSGVLYRFLGFMLIGAGWMYVAGYGIFPVVIAFYVFGQLQHYVAGLNGKPYRR